MRRSTAKALYIALLTSQGMATAAEARAAVPEYAMKAAYLYNFAKLTDWPAAPASGLFDLCILGQDDFSAPLETLRGKTINGLPLNVRHISNLTEAQACQLLFLGAGERVAGKHLLDALQQTPVLTVTDASHPARTGAMLVLITEERRLSFEVHHALAKRAQLNLSSKLLRLAKRVTQ